MNHIKPVLMVGVMVGTLIATVGCGRVAASPPKVPISTKPHDGMVSRYRLLHPPNLPSGVKLYQIEYWSDHHQVEALMTEPGQAGRYPLLVNLHGGYLFGGPHWNFGYTPAAAAGLAFSSVVELYPEYQGYIGSPGRAKGVRIDFSNLQDAIRIAKQFGEVKVNDTYLLGYSLGGDLALMTAGWDHQVRAVVAVSPLVGLSDVVQWSQAHQGLGPTAYPGEFLGVVDRYGPNIHSLAYRERSPNPAAIRAPVLLLQGTGDKEVVWQTVRLFADQMTHADRTVKLILYRGGQHGLHGGYEAASARAMDQWFKRYGLNIALNNY
ncbi:alpha/beta hydrolase family protein [Sulfobacillus harzensis]|uniref:Prolyl oligopeptidase family serine peptidase n=1 Tax=Sulfobacillus harzensis TaxID=2729629 RepID=A0A7Y0Q3T9_9FIRM|nr:prolyl oligopeptidase family serine peptidase [Sulfobacillus harzensis]NMP24633.1 prolyl oligopeptidase family serine peptidase [Sulfobacillus harzensis]